MVVKLLGIWCLIQTCFFMISCQINRNQRIKGNHHPLIAESPGSLITQSFQKEPEYLEINPGANALMECRVFGKSRSSMCIWQKDGIPIRMPQDGKYEWYGGMEHGDCSLKIIKADINYDDGKIIPSPFKKLIVSYLYITSTCNMDAF